MIKTIKNTTHQSGSLRERPAQMVRAREAEPTMEMRTRMTIDHILEVRLHLLEGM